MPKLKKRTEFECELSRTLWGLANDVVTDCKVAKIAETLIKYEIPCPINPTDAQNFYLRCFIQSKETLLGYALPSDIRKAITNLKPHNFKYEKFELDNLIIIFKGKCFQAKGVEVGSKKMTHGLRAHLSKRRNTPKDLRNVSHAIFRDELHQRVFRGLGLQTFTVYEEDKREVDRNLQLFLENSQIEING